MSNLPRTPDFDVYPVRRRLRSVVVCDGGVLVEWDDGLRSHHHPLWLRENAADEDTCHPVTREQRLMLHEIPADTAVVSAAVDAAGALAVRWSTGGESRYHPGWLRVHSLGAEADRPQLPDRVLWDAALGSALPRFQAADVLADPDAFARWATALYSYGVAIVGGIGTSPGDTAVLPSRVGPIRESNFGRIFDVRTRPDATSNAYTAMALPVHVDLATRERMPGLQFLHCLENETDGGDSLLADGFSIAAKIEAEAPDAYAALSTVPLLFANKAADSDYRFEAPMFRQGPSGGLEEVRWSPWLRGPVAASFADTERVYRGLRMAFSMGAQPSSQVRVRLEAGELLCMDNRRILHGRTGFDPASGGRWLRGCYVDREELASQLRIAARRERAVAHR